MILFLVTRSPIKAITSVQRAGNGIRKTEVNGYNVPFVNSGFTKYAFSFKSNFQFSGGRRQRIVYFTNLTVLRLLDSEIMMKWRVLTLFRINLYRITQERYSIFLSMIVKSTPLFPVFSVGRININS